jgi:benzoyl-CoA reductase/2-hydroxyglutaryl-CoA dehydratase subunit BcrC/BadD/HgdB
MALEDKVGLKRTIEYRDRLKNILDELEKLPAEMQNPVQMGFLRCIMEHDEKTIECIETNKPMVSTWYGNAPEILAAMDIHFFNPVDNILGHLNLTELYDLKESDKISLPDDICSLIRLASYSVQDGLVPKPTAMVALLEPCDAQPLLHESFKHNAWDDVPDFGLDYTYGSSDEDYQFFAGELKRMIDFLEQVHPGYKMDYDKLRQVVEETNRQYEIWGEYNELRRAKPCPAASFQGSVIGWPLTQHIEAGKPGVTEVLRLMLADAETKVKAGIGAVPDEQIRILWTDLAPTWHEQLSPWLAEEWHANVVMDFQGYTPYVPIDTSTPDSMLMGIARRMTSEVPMIRQARGAVDVFLEDITRIVNDYSIDFIIFPGHMGHKDQSATISFLQQLCRDLNVPLLSLTTSLFDERYMPIPNVKKKISEFIGVMGLGNKR